MVWVKLWNRKHTLQHDFFGRFLWFIQNPYYKIKNIIRVGTEKNKADFYCQKDEWNRLMTELSKEVFKKDFLNKVLHRFQVDKKRFREAAVRLNKKDELKNLSNKELIQIYESLKK